MAGAASTNLYPSQRWGNKNVKAGCIAHTVRGVALISLKADEGVDVSTIRHG